MSAPDFLDTNVLIYGYNASDSRKQRRAQDLIRKALSGEALTSTQVLAEFAAALLHKALPRIHPKEVLLLLDALGPINLVETDAEIVRRAVDARNQYGIHFFDGMVVAAAERGGCKRIWSEDFNAGQKYFGIEVENPFR